MTGEKSYLEEAMTTADKSCLGMFHGRISKILVDLEAEKELEQELRVRKFILLTHKFTALVLSRAHCQRQRKNCLRPKWLLVTLTSARMS